MPGRRALASSVLALALVGVAGCGGDEPDPGDAVPETTTTTATSTTTTVAPTTTTAPATTTTAADAGSTFDGSTTPTSAPEAPGLAGPALLTDVAVSSAGGVDRVTFTFDVGIPGYDVAYIDPPVRQDGSGDEVAVDGSAFLEIRFAPASGFDLGGTLEETYTGPSRVEGDTSAVTEVVRTGDFEANLTWVVGLDQEVPFRVTTDAASGQVEVTFDAS